MVLDCKARALRYLKGRAYSIFEMRAKLSSQKYSSKEVNRVIGELISMGLLNDRAFTASFIATRLARSFGFIRIMAELEYKGISKDLIKEQVKAAQTDYNEDEVLLELVEQKAKGVKDMGSFLTRRGFSTQAVMKVLD